MKLLIIALTMTVRIYASETYIPNIHLQGVDTSETTTTTAYSEHTQQEPDVYYAQVALFTPLQVIDKKHSILGVTWNILYGENHNNKGITFGLVNSSLHIMGGVQLGFYNHAGKAYGFQCGLINNARDIHGFQFGLINRSIRLTGVQIGLLNIVESSDFLKYMPILNAQF